MNIVLHIEGGVGKCIMGTALIKGLRKKYPNDTLIVVSGYSDIFFNNPHVDHAFNFGEEAYFYSKYFENKEAKFFAHNPYLEIEHIQRSEHLLNTWFRLCGLEYEGETPEMYLTEQEINLNYHRINSEKPIFVIQPFGGSPSDIKYSWCRDLPLGISQRIVNEYKDTYNVVQIKREDQHLLDGATPFTDNIRHIAVLLLLSKKRLLIDSFGQHLAFALQIPSVVCWIGNSEKVFGYDLHKNILANPHTKKPELRNSYFGKFNIQGDPLEFPYQSEKEIFDYDVIKSSIEEL